MLALSNCLSLNVIRPFMSHITHEPELYALHVHAVLSQTWGMLFFPHYNPQTFLHRAFYACFESRIGIIVWSRYFNVITTFLSCSISRVMRSQTNSKCHHFKRLLPWWIHSSPHAQIVYPEKWLFPFHLLRIWDTVMVCDSKAEMNIKEN